MQVAVRNEDHGIVVIDFLNDCRNRIIQLAGDHVPPLAGEDFQTALGVDSGQHWILHAVQLDGFFQLLVIIAVDIDRNGVELRLFQICRMECNEVRFALFGNRQRFLCLFIRRQQPIFKNLCDFRAGRTKCGGAGHGSRHRLCCGWRFRRLLRDRWFFTVGIRLCVGGLVWLLGRGVLLLRRCIRFFGGRGRRGIFHRFFNIWRWRSFFFGSLFRRFRRRIRLLAVYTCLFRRYRFLRFFRLLCSFYGFRFFLCLFLLRCRHRFYFCGLLRRFGWFLTLFADLAFRQQPTGRRADALIPKTELLCFFFRHVIDKSGNFCFLCQFACLAAAVAGDDLKLAVLALAQDDRFLDALENDAACQRLQTFRTRRRKDAAGQVMDFRQRNVDRLALRHRGIACFFFCHVLPPKIYVKKYVSP